MRVIAGSRRHLILKTVPGMAVRPTQDRTKETLFNMISEYLADSNFLDLFSGSGAIGIEALSRGAAHASFVEQKILIFSFHLFLEMLFRVRNRGFKVSSDRTSSFLHL